MRRVQYSNLDVLKCKLKVVLVIFTLNRFADGPGWVAFKHSPSPSRCADRNRSSSIDHLTRHSGLCHTEAPFQWSSDWINCYAGSVYCWCRRWV